MRFGRHSKTYQVVIGLFVQVERLDLQHLNQVVVGASVVFLKNYLTESEHCLILKL